MNYLQKKKLAFMSIVNSVKGFVRTVMGVPPLTLPDCVDENSLISYAISGTGVGDFDEETSKYKIPVVCSGKNLLKPEHFKYRSINASNVWGNTYGLWVFAKANKTYKFSISKLVNCTSYRICFALYDSNKNLITNTTEANAYDLDKYTTMSCNYYTGWYHNVAHTYVPNGNMTNTDNIVITFTPKQDLYISWYLSYGNATANTYAEEPQIEEGSTSTDYEPYVEPVTTNIYLDKPLAEGEMLKNPVKLPTVKGTTIYTIGTDVQPSKMDATYYATSKE